MEAGHDVDAMLVDELTHNRFTAPNAAVRVMPLAAFGAGGIMLRIDELAFRIVCGMIVEDITWAQIGDHSVSVHDASAGLTLLVRELGARMHQFLDAKSYQVDGDERFMFTHDDNGHPSPNIDDPDFGVYIGFDRIGGLRFSCFRGAGRKGARPGLHDKSMGYSVMRCW